MEKSVSVYYYDTVSKREFWGTAKSKHIYKQNISATQATAQKLLDDRAEVFYHLSFDDGAPTGTYLTDVLSINFEKKINGMEAMTDMLGGTKVSKSMLPADLHFLVEFKPEQEPAKLLADLQKMYYVKCFLDLCIKEPSLFTLSSLQRLCSVVHEKSCVPQTLGFFIPVEIEGSSQFLFGDVLLDNSNPKWRNTRDLYDIQLDVNQLYKTHFRYPLPQTAVEVYKVSSVLDKVFASLFALVQDGISIGKCGNCSKYFIPQGRAIYCDRPSPQDSNQTCKEYGTKRLWYDNLKKDEVAKLARTVYTAKQMLVRRNPDNEQYKALFDYFKTERKKWERAVKAGEKTAEEYMEWLNIMRMHKTLEPTLGVLPIPPSLPDND